MKDDFRTPEHRLAAFGDALADGNNPPITTDLDATLAHMQRLLGDTAGIPASRKHLIWEELMTTADPTAVPQPLPSMAPRRTLQPALGAAVWRGQPVASMVLVFAILAGLVGLAVVRGPGRQSETPSVPAANQALYDPQQPDTYPPVPAACAANGTVTSNDDLARQSIDTWPSPAYTPARAVTYEQGAAVQQTFLNYLRCEADAVKTGAASATPLPPTVANPELLTYFSDRARYDRLFAELSPAQQADLQAYRCLPRLDELERAYPLPVNQPRDQALLDGNPVTIFAPSDVYLLPDGRYGAIAGSISTTALTEPAAVTENDTLMFYAFTEVDGRFFIDELFTLVSRDQSAIDQAGRNGTLALDCA